MDMKENNLAYNEDEFDDWDNSNYTIEIKF